MIQIKNAAELEKMRKAAAISAAALKAGGEAIEPGITTAEIDKIIYDFIVRHGARPNFLHLYGFPATACISVNDTVIHGIPSRDQKIRPGDIVSIDTGCKIDGLTVITPVPCLRQARLGSPAPAGCDQRESAPWHCCRAGRCKSGGYRPRSAKLRGGERFLRCA